MRTTVTLDDDLEHLLRETAVRTHRPFKKVLNETLRHALETQVGSKTPEPFIVRASPMGLRSGLDPAASNRLVDDLEAEAFLETTRKLVEQKS